MNVIWSVIKPVITIPHIISELFPINTSSDNINDYSESVTDRFYVIPLYLYCLEQ